MKSQRVLMSIAFVAGSFGIVMAQTAAPAQPSVSPDRMTTITVTGCVQRNPAPPAATAGAIGQASANFILTNARRAAGDSTPEAQAVASSVKTYRLIGDEPEVTDTLGRHVEITGTLDQGNGATELATGASTPKLTVTMVKLTPGSCTP
jgi:hypothetical protein